MPDIISSIYSISLFIYAIAYFILGFIVYHRIFDVVYFDLGRGCMQEIIGCIFFSAIMTVISIVFWPIAVVILLVVAFVIYNKSKNVFLAALFVIFAIFTTITGIYAWKNGADNNKSNNNSIQIRKTITLYVYDDSIKYFV